MRVTGDVDPGAEQRSRAELADQIRQKIVSEKLTVGAKLPSYRDLAKEFRAAPNTVGEAMRLLATEGRVKIKPNARAEVSDPRTQATTADQQLQEARIGLTEVRDQLRAVRRDVDALESRVTDLIAGLPND